ncbi:MAG: TIGR01621 family pseudouridine synthase, partial [Vibrio sp.]
FYEHPDFLIVNKAPNVSVHKDDADEPWVNAIAQQCGVEKLYLVHRLDKMTSGMVILAKHAMAVRELSNLFAMRQIDKFYLAISSQKPKKKQGLICGDMQKSRRSMWKLTQNMHNPAVTQFISKADDTGMRLFLCKPYTGQTHQIRVALTAIGAPILGDPLYGNAKHNLNVDRGYLHAYAMRFSYQNQVFEFVCPPKMMQGLGKRWQDESIQAVLNQWQTPWLLTWPKLAKHLLYQESASH